MTTTSSVFRYPLKIREAHLDTFGHVNNATYLSLLEEARWELITQGGFGLDHIRKVGLGPVVLEIKIRYLRELRLRDDVVIETWLDSYPGKTGLIKQRILDSSGGICTEADIGFGLFDTKIRKLVAPTPEWLAAIGVVSGS